MKSFELWMCQWQTFVETDLMDVVGWPAVVLGIITSTNDGCGDIAAMIHHKFNQVRTSLSCCLITKSRKRQQKSPIADKWTPTKNLLSEDCFNKLWFSENIWWHITWWSLFQTISWFLRAASHCPMFTHCQRCEMAFTQEMATIPNSNKLLIKPMFTYHHKGDVAYKHRQYHKNCLR